MTVIVSDALRASYFHELCGRRASLKREHRADFQFHIDWDIYIPLDVTPCHLRLEIRCTSCDLMTGLLWTKPRPSQAIPKRALMANNPPPSSAAAAFYFCTNAVFRFSKLHQTILDRWRNCTRSGVVLRDMRNRVPGQRKNVLRFRNRRSFSA
jgi:hypothetical protein